jgi:hypothetical protein
MIDLAEALSTRLCEQCGKPGDMRSIKGFRTVRCEEHAPPES